MDSNVLFQDMVLIVGGGTDRDSLNLNLGEVLRTARCSPLHQLRDLRPEDIQ